MFYYQLPYCQLTPLQAAVGVVQKVFTLYISHKVYRKEIFVIYLIGLFN